jgi:biotin synthase
MMNMSETNRARNTLVVPYATEASAEPPTESSDHLRHDWQLSEVLHLFSMPFGDLMAKARAALCQFFDPNQIVLSTLLNVKTGGCPENCHYCPQSAHYKTGLERQALMQVDEVRQAAKLAQQAGATRFCMGAAWRSPTDRDLDSVIEMVRAIKDLGMESCATLGMLKADQAQRLKDAGLDYYNHNIDTSPEYYDKIITTRDFADRIETLDHVQKAGMHTCSGGIIGMGETVEDRANMLITLANRDRHPQSVPINMLIKIKGSPLEHAPDLAPLDFVRVIAVARILMPASHVRLSAGRTQMSDETQALCFLAGANSIFYGDTLLTADNPAPQRDAELFRQLGLTPVKQQGDNRVCTA